MKGLERFAATEQAPPFTVKPLTITWRGNILAFDQTLGGCGFVCIKCVSSSTLAITHVGMYKADHVRTKGNLGNLEKADHIFDCVMGLMDVLEIDAVVHEAPPPGGGRMARPESSLMAATCVRNAAAAHHLRVLHHVEPRTAKKRFTGKADAEKKEVHAALRCMVPGMVNMRTNNENTRDALAVAIVAAEREMA